MKLTRLSLMALLAAAVALAYSPTVRAQDAKEGKDAPKREGGKGGGRGANMQERLDKMAEELKLTDDQKKKVEEVMKAQGEKMRGLRDATPEERQEKMKAAREEMSKKMKEILTADQFAKWEKMPRPGRGPGGSGGPEGGKKAEKN